MPLQNRVTPFGEIVTAPWRGRFTGNRGCLHNETGTLGIRRWRHQNWVCCLTAFRGRYRDPMPPGRWTALFFWDEAAALAAGHRPCGECRYRDYKRFMECWQRADLPGDGPRDVDKFLHRNRVTRRREQVRHVARSRDLPDGTFLVVPGSEHLPMLLRGGNLWHLDLNDQRYYAAGPSPSEVIVLSPKPIVDVMRAGYEPRIDALPAAGTRSLT